MTEPIVIDIIPFVNMFKGLIASFLIFCSSFFSGGDQLVDCRLRNGQIVHVKASVCKKMNGQVVNPKPTPTIKPTPTVKPSVTPTVTPFPTATLTPTMTPTPIVAKITKVEVHNCSVGSSCYGWLTSVEVTGANFGEDSRTKLRSGSNEYSGVLMGANATSLITDFTNLPHCKTFDTVVYGSTGIATASASVSTLCP